MKNQRFFRINDPKLWLYMADGFERAAHTSYPKYPFHVGLCLALAELTCENANSDWVYWNSDCFVGNVGGYLWSCTPQGWLDRAAFCRGMAERIRAGEHFHWSAPSSHAN